MANTIRRVTWHLPKTLFERLEKVKAVSQENLAAPPNITIEEFAFILLDQALRAYESEVVAPSKLIVSPPGLVIPR